MDAKDVKRDAEPEPQQEPKQPPEWRRALNPDHLAGQNIGPVSSADERGVATAYDLERMHRALPDLDDDEPKKIPILPSGTRLQQGATYIDLADAPPRELTAMGGTTTEPGHHFVPRDEVPHPLWNRLIGGVKPGRRSGRPAEGTDGTAADPWRRHPFCNIG